MRGVVAVLFGHWGGGWAGKLQMHFMVVVCFAPYRKFFFFFRNKSALKVLLFAREGRLVNAPAGRSSFCFIFF